ncbi:hypothetical protein EV652_119115 [Kribbella steppae]|uniref:Uncharacterized protein n=1 Tax=Kribbella steppae TaxID=2512223 RepID=A0A4R2H0J5_9ACTN|nr:hypothetical protein EV652_119115 [Kribbella steppae]
MARVGRGLSWRAAREGDCGGARWAGTVVACGPGRRLWWRGSGLRECAGRGGVRQVRLRRPLRGSSTLDPHHHDQEGRSYPGAAHPSGRVPRVDAVARCSPPGQRKPNAQRRTASPRPSPGTRDPHPRPTISGVNPSGWGLPTEILSGQPTTSVVNPRNLGGSGGPERAAERERGRLGDRPVAQRGCGGLAVGWLFGAGSSIARSSSGVRRRRSSSRPWTDITRGCGLFPAAAAVPPGAQRKQSRPTI